MDTPSPLTPETALPQHPALARWLMDPENYDPPFTLEEIAEFTDDDVFEYGHEWAMLHNEEYAAIVEAEEEEEEEKNQDED